MQLYQQIIKNKTLEGIKEVLENHYRLQARPDIRDHLDKFLTGCKRLERGLLEEALESFHNAESIDRTHFFTQFHLGKLYLYGVKGGEDVVDLERAEKHFRLAVRCGIADASLDEKMKPLAAEAYLHASMACFIQAVRRSKFVKLSEAQELVSEAIRLNPRLGEAFYLRAKYNAVKMGLNPQLSAIGSTIEPVQASRGDGGKEDEEGSLEADDVSLWLLTNELEKVAAVVFAGRQTLEQAIASLHRPRDLSTVSDEDWQEGILEFEEDVAETIREWRVQMPPYEEVKRDIDLRYGHEMFIVNEQGELLFMSWSEKMPIRTELARAYSARDYPILENRFANEKLMQEYHHRWIEEKIGEMRKPLLEKARGIPVRPLSSEITEHLRRTYDEKLVALEQVYQELEQTRQKVAGVQVGSVEYAKALIALAQIAPDEALALPGFPRESVTSYSGSAGKLDMIKQEFESVFKNAVADGVPVDALRPPPTMPGSPLTKEELMLSREAPLKTKAYTVRKKSKKQPPEEQPLQKFREEPTEWYPGDHPVLKDLESAIRIDRRYALRASEDSDFDSVRGYFNSFIRNWTIDMRRKAEDKLGIVKKSLEGTVMEFIDAEIFLKEYRTLKTLHEKIQNMPPIRLEEVAPSYYGRTDNYKQKELTSAGESLKRQRETIESQITSGYKQLAVGEAFLDVNKAWDLADQAERNYTSLKEDMAEEPARLILGRKQELATIRRLVSGYGNEVRSRTANGQCTVCGQEGLFGSAFMKKKDGLCFCKEHKERRDHVAEAVFGIFGRSAILPSRS